MNKRQKEILQIYLGSEKACIKDIEEQYKEALNEVLAQIAIFRNRILADETDTSALWQLKYQEVLKKQIDDILEKLHKGEYDTIYDYLNECYINGRVGVVYDLDGQGIPLILPINQEEIVISMLNDSKLSLPLYERLGVDVDYLKRKIRVDVTRGIIQGSSYNEISRNISQTVGVSESKTFTIARTEGHRITETSAFETQKEAKKMGCDIVKQWDSTLDSRTRPSHRQVDGEIRELEDKFSNGLLHPSDKDGKASEVVNCRCALLQRAKWVLDEEELATLKERAKFYELDKTKNFDEFKEKYLKIEE